MEEILLGILVYPQGNYIQGFRFGNLRDPVQAGFHGWQTKVVS